MHKAGRGLNTDRVIVGMSGGVDSSIAAHLLKERGYEVIGVTLHVWANPAPSSRDRERGCCAVDAVGDAMDVCERLGIPHRLVDARNAFTAGVIEPFADAYISGRTPNPCIECNRAVKFDALLRVAAREGAGLIATGHYARLERTADSRVEIRRSRDVRKDQSYVLYALTQETLGRLLLPIGELAKEDVRRIARENSLPVADKADSVEICFVPDGDHGGFLSRFRPGAMVPGPVSDIEGRTVGTHEGIARYTIGQRRGLGVAAGERRYVVRIDAGGNRVVLGSRSDLAVSTIDVESMNWVSAHGPTAGPVFVQYRSTMTAVPGEFSPGLHGGGRVRFSSPQYGVAAGQAAVLYDGDRLLGGGTVAATSPISALVEAL